MYTILLYGGFALAGVLLIVSAALFIRNKIPQTIAYFIKMRSKKLIPAQSSSKQQENTEVLAVAEHAGTMVLESNSTVLLDEIQEE